MDKSKFLLQLEEQWSKNKFVCVGLDSGYSQLPESIKVGKTISEAMFSFNQSIVDNTYDLVCAYKPNAAFYEAEGLEGLNALKQTVDYIHQKYPNVPIILDGKRGDTGNTSTAYAKSAFEDLNVDAVTVNPYQGQEALQPFLDYQDKGVIVLVKTSNPGGGEFQDLLVEGRPLYQVVAEHITKGWNKNGNCAVVVGATYPQDLAKVREIVGDIPILIPGIGAQGGELEATIKAGKDSRGWGMIINSSRGIIFASKGDAFAEDARKATAELHYKILGSL